MLVQPETVVKLILQRRLGVGELESKPTINLCIEGLSYTAAIQHSRRHTQVDVQMECSLAGM